MTIPKPLVDDPGYGATQPSRRWPLRIKIYLAIGGFVALLAGLNGLGTLDRYCFNVASEAYLDIKGGRAEKALSDTSFALLFAFGASSRIELRRSHARAAMELKQFDVAIADLQTAIESTTNNDPASDHFSLGICFAERNRLSDSIAEFDQAISLMDDPQNRSELLPLARRWRAVVASKMAVHSDADIDER